MTYSDTDIMDALRRDQDATDNWIRITPLDNFSQVQPASIDLRLGTEFMCFDPAEFVDMGERIVSTHRVTCYEGTYFELKPRELVLATTVERVELGSRVRAGIEGKSSLGRMGLVVHVTAGFVDPGFMGQITLELYNLSPSPIRVRPGLAICQIAFVECTTRASRPYGSPGLGSRYQNQSGVVPVRP